MPGGIRDEGMAVVRKAGLFIATGRQEIAFSA